MSDNVNYVNVSGKKMRRPTGNNIDTEIKPNFSTQNSIKLK